MVITVDDIRNRLHTIWPNLDQIWCFDPEYDCPQIGDVRELIQLYTIDMPAHRKDLCNYTALQFHAYAAHANNWAIGEAFGNKINGWSILHNLNIAVCQDGVYLIDVRAISIRLAESYKDNILFARFT